MVSGFESFREHFAGYEDCYTIIGGTACDILMTDAALEFRATKDVDMIVLLEERFPAFGQLFWSYVKAGGYRCGWKKDSAPHFYRFTEPTTAGYPTMIELFSRRPDFKLHSEDAHLTPLPISEEVSSLSAIMLDNDYYQLMLNGRRTVQGVSVLGAEYLVLFKAKAWLDLTEKKAAGQHVNDRDLRKHRGDVFRLYSIVDPTLRIDLPEKVAAEMSLFFAEVEQAKLDVRQYGIEDVTFAEVMMDYRRIYGLG